MGSAIQPPDTDVQRGGERDPRPVRQQQQGRTAVHPDDSDVNPGGPAPTVAVAGTQNPDDPTVDLFPNWIDVNGNGEVDEAAKAAACSTAVASTAPSAME